MQFTENDVQKCLLSYGFFSMTKILKELEEEDRFEECQAILDAMIAFKDRFSFFKEKLPLQWSEKLEQEYYNYFEKLTDEGELLAKKNLEGYLKEIKKRLKL